MLVKNPIISGLNPLPQIYIITGTDGSGKDTIIRQLRTNNPKLHFAVTHTDRTPRPNEANGIDYHFVSTIQFQNMIDNDEFIEHALIYGYHKGVSRGEITLAMQSGSDVLLRINIDGAISVKKHFPSAVSIFVTTESKEILHQRLKTRNSDSEEEIQKRLDDFERIYSLIDSCDYIVINKENELTESVKNVESIMLSSKLKVNYNIPSQYHHIMKLTP